MSAYAQIPKTSLAGVCWQRNWLPTSTWITSCSSAFHFQTLYLKSFSCKTISSQWTTLLGLAKISWLAPEGWIESLSLYGLIRPKNECLFVLLPSRVHKSSRLKMEHPDFRPQDVKRVWYCMNNNWTAWINDFIQYNAAFYVTFLCIFRNQLGPSPPI